MLSILRRVFFVAMVLQTSIAVWARTTIAFDNDWRFFKGDKPGAEELVFDDFTWSQINVPHDWSIEGPFAQTNKTGGAGAFLPSGIAWYQKEFILPAELSNECVLIEFDGAMAHSTVWVNGHKLGYRPNGYVGFQYDLTPYLKFGQNVTNVVAVRADTSDQPASRWYAGAGIYRHVRLVAADLFHFDYNATFISTPVIRSNEAVVRIQTRVANNFKSAREVSLSATVYGPPGSAPDGCYSVQGKSETTKVAAGAEKELELEVKIPWAPRIWNVEHPDLHTARVKLESAGKILDEENISFGIRDAKFTADKGFVLNGRKVLLKGVCIHQDAGGVGVAVPLSIWERRLEALRQLGCNAIRTSHNPVAPEFLDLCDRMGFLVMDEFFDCWTVGKNKYDYHRDFETWSLRDLRDTVRRDRNHPSVILYCAGNEIHDTRKPEMAKQTLAKLMAEFKANDPTRPVTQALFRPNATGDYTNGLADLLDVVGTNYRDQELLKAQSARPDWKIIGTEQRHDLETWLDCRNHPSHSGQFLWTGIDYLGETRQWPRNTFTSGLIDRTGWIKPQACQRQSWWSDQPMVCIARRVAPDDVLPTDPGYGGEERFTQVTFSDWSPRNSDAHKEDVEVYSNGEEVELFLNGQSLGVKNKPADDSPRKWVVPFKPGKLEAIARNGGKVVASQTLQTAGLAAKIKLISDRPSLSLQWDDVAILRVEITDANGVTCPYANQLVRFSVKGPGHIIAVDNGDAMSTEPFQIAQRKAYGGRCIAIVRATAAAGRITVTAQADKLAPASVDIECKSFSQAKFESVKKD
jgi:beta-galactosidase